VRAIEKEYMKVKKQACKYEDRHVEGLVTGMYDRSNTWRKRDIYDDAYQNQHDMYEHNITTRQSTKWSY